MSTTTRPTDAEFKNFINNFKEFAEKTNAKASEKIFNWLISHKSFIERMDDLQFETLLGMNIARNAVERVRGFARGDLAEHVARNLHLSTKTIKEIAEHDPAALRALNDGDHEWPVKIRNHVVPIKSKDLGSNATKIILSAYGREKPRAKVLTVAEQGEPRRFIPECYVMMAHDSDKDNGGIKISDDAIVAMELGVAKAKLRLTPAQVAELYHAYAEGL